MIAGDDLADALADLLDVCEGVTTYLRLSTKGEGQRFQAYEAERREAAIMRFREAVKGAGGTQGRDGR
jgi:hypothetical protein